MTTMKINEKKNTIEITKTFAQKAARVGSPEYFELLEVRHNFPKFKVVVNQTKSKDSFKGLTYEYMEKYIKAHDDKEGSNMAVFNELRGKGDDAEGAMADSMSQRIYLIEKPLCKTKRSAGFDEMARDEARHGKAFEGLLKRYFGK